MEITPIFNFLLIAGAVQGFIFNIATFLGRKKVEKPILFLNLFIFFLSLNNLQSWLIDIGFIDNYFLLSNFRVPFYVLIVPMFYAFLVYYLDIESKKTSFLKVTMAIFLIAILARSTFLIYIKKQHLPLEYITLYNTIEDAVTLAYSLFLFIKALRILYKYESLYESILAFDNLNWFKKFMKLGGVVILLWLIAVFLNLFSNSIKEPYSYYPLRLGSSILIYWVGYQAFFQYVLLKDRIVLRREIRKEPKLKFPDNSKKVDRSERATTLFKEINNYIQSNQVYLDPQLGLEKVAGAIGLGVSSFSKIINEQTGQNFSDYINSLRVNEAKNLLSNEEFSNYTIVAIGLECGFNSKSTFYSAFKKFTGQTPSSFRIEIFFQS